MNGAITTNIIQALGSMLNSNLDWRNGSYCVVTLVQSLVSEPCYVFHSNSSVSAVTHGQEGFIASIVHASIDNTIITAEYELDT